MYSIIWSWNIVEKNHLATWGLELVFKIFLYTSIALVIKSCRASAFNEELIIQYYPFTCKLILFGLLDY